VDTRTKIVGAAEFNSRLDQWRSEGIEIAIAAGSFDPLLAVHAAQTAAARPDDGRLAVMVTEPPDAILDARARAELVAGLAAVDLVTLDCPGLPDPDLDWTSVHASAAATFVAHVLDRMS
jgi:hypothetical protein